MTDAPSEQSAPSTPAPSLPTDTTPTWEIELLISGALAYGSLQLPGVFDDWFVPLVPRLTESLVLPVILGYVFLKSLATTLTLTFGLHIVLRGFWAAALGLHSVYPEGILWDNVKSGPIFRAVTREVVAPLPVYVSRLDNISSLVFALGAVLLIMSALSSIFAVAAMGSTYALASITGGELQPLVGAAFAFVVLALPMISAGMIDKRFGERLPPNSRRRAWLERIARASTAVSGTRATGPMLLVFTSRQGQTKGTLIVVAVLYLVFGLVFVQAALRLDFFDFNTYRYLSTSGDAVARPAYYATQRTGTKAFSPIPFIENDIIDDQVLRVFVPYRMRRFDEVLRADCPAAAAAATGTDTLAQRAAPRAVVDCFAKLLQPRMDGAPVAGASWWLGTDAASEQRGFVLMVPLRDVAEGPHILGLNEIRRVDEKARDKPDTYAIPFFYAPR